MKTNIDIKSLIIGILLGAVVFLAMGQGLSGAGKADFAIAVQNGGDALVRSDDGTIYSVDLQRARAEIVVHNDGPLKGRFMNTNQAAYKQGKNTNKSRDNY